jgi:hypothetical protein
MNEWSPTAAGNSPLVRTRWLAGQRKPVSKRSCNRDLAQVAVVDPAGRFAGVLTARGPIDADGGHDHSSAGSVAERVAAVRGDQALDAALDILESATAAAIPVLDPAGTEVIGWLTHQRILSVIRRRLAPTPPSRSLPEPDRTQPARS